MTLHWRPDFRPVVVRCIAPRTRSPRNRYEPRWAAEQVLEPAWRQFRRFGPARTEITPVIDRTYPLDDTVDAHAYVDRGHKRGNLIIGVD